MSKMPLRVHFYNHVARHWHNWRIRRMWRSDPNRPRICPQAAKMTPEIWAWAQRRAESIEIRRKAASALLEDIAEIQRLNKRGDNCEAHGTGNAARDNLDAKP